MWVQLSGDGRPLGVRSLITAASGGTSRAGVEDVTRRTADGHSVLEQYDPATGKVKHHAGRAAGPGRRLRGARPAREGARRRQRRHARRRGDVRRSSRLQADRHRRREPAEHGDRDELVVDAESYAPLALIKHSEGIAVDGKPFTYDYTERIVGRRTLPDTAANREQLRLHGPTG